MLPLLFFAIIVIMLETWGISFVYELLIPLFGKDLAFLLNLTTIIGSSIWGAKLLRQQGHATMQALQQAASRGESPADALIDQLMILCGALLLIIPGYFTSLLGFSLVLPTCRKLYKKRVRGLAERGEFLKIIFPRGRGQQGYQENPYDPFKAPNGPRRQNQQEEVIDVEAEDLNKEKNNS